MIYNALGFLLLAFMARTRWPLAILGNAYILVGASAVIALAYFSGGILSALYPWIISIPVLALLVVGRKAAIVWGAISFAVMLWFGIWSEMGHIFPVEYNIELRNIWFLSVLPGLMLIILLISLVFEYTQSQALASLEKQKLQITEQHTTISEQSKRLEKLVENKDYIIRILAHDLRGPLNNIASLIELLSSEPPADEREEYQRMIRHTIKNARHLVDRVLEMDASSQGQVQLHKKSVIVGDFLAQLVNTATGLATAKDISLRLEDRTNGAVLNTDPTYLELVIENLLSNAIKFSRYGGKVKVVAQLEGDKVVIRIIDNGPGVAANEQSRLFQKFTKLSARPTAGEASTGLGLSLVKRYIEILDGDVWYEDNPDRGGIFSVSLDNHLAAHEDHA